MKNYSTVSQNIKKCQKKSLGTETSCVLNLVRMGVWRAESLFSLSVKGISCTRVISDFHLKSPDLVTISFDLSKVTVPDE